MASVKTISALAVVIILVAAAAAVAITYDGGNDDNTGSPGIKSDLAVGDYYTIVEYEEAATIGADSAETTTKTEITGIAGDGTLTVEVTTSTDGTDASVTETMSSDEFVAGIHCYIEDTSGLASETLAVDGSTVECWVYVNEASSGSWTFRTIDYVSKDGYIVYRTVAEATFNGETTTLVKDLQATNLITEGGTGGSGSSSGTSPGTSEARTSLEVGDYITYQETDEDGRVSIETIEIVGIDGNYVYVTENDSDDREVDYERRTASWFTGRLLFGSTAGMTYSTTETITLTIDGEAVTVQCNVYIDEDREDRDTYWVGASDGVLYKAEYYDKEDNETESKVLTGTSLLSGSSGSGGSPGTSSGASSGTGTTNSFGVELAVGDTYTIVETDENGRTSTETYTIVSIDGYRVTVMETEDGRTSHDVTSANDFLDDIMMTQNQLASAVSTGTAAVKGTVCDVYTFVDGDETETYYVDSSTGLILLVEETDRDGTETVELTSYTLSFI